MWTKHTRFTTMGHKLTEARLAELDSRHDYKHLEKVLDDTFELIERHKPARRLPSTPDTWIHALHNGQSMFEIDHTKYVCGTTLPGTVTINGMTCTVAKWEIRLKVPNMEMKYTFNGESKAITVFKKYWELVDCFPDVLEDQRPKLIAIGKFE